MLDHIPLNRLSVRDAEKPLGCRVQRLADEFLHVRQETRLHVEEGCEFVDGGFREDVGREGGRGEMVEMDGFDEG